MCRILIWDIPLQLKANTGGPAGYLYNIKKYIDSHPDIDNIKFASQIINAENSSVSYQPKVSGLKKAYRDLRLKKGIRGIFKIFEFFNYIRAFYHKEKDLPINIGILNGFDIIHFHSTIHLINVRHLLNNYNGKLVITTHCPEPYSIEVLSMFFKQDFIINFFKPIFLKKEIEGWKSCDYLVFPVPQAVEVYFKSKGLHRYYLKNEEKFKFCPSSITENVELKGVDIKTKYGIPTDSFIVSFVGRHNKVKGYDQLKIFAEKVLEKYKNVYFIIAGLETPLTRLEHPRWIELGVVDYVSDILEQADVFVLPNRETYFDLVALEVLRMGTPLLLSNTGGNKYFKTLPSKEIQGLYFYEYGNMESQLEEFEKIYKLTPDRRFTIIRHSNITLFKNYFTSSKFLDRYVNIMEEIRGNNINNK